MSERKRGFGVRDTSEENIVGIGAEKERAVFLYEMNRDSPTGLIICSLFGLGVGTSLITQAS